MEQNLEVVKIEGVRGYVDAQNVVWLNVEDVARGLGFTESKSGVEYVRWRTINGYLKSLGFSQEVAKDSFIPENIFYRLAMKASNETAKKFQAKVADEILPAIRKIGVYMTLEAAEKILYNPDFIIKLAQQIKGLSAQVAELKPKAEYCEKVLESEECLPVTIIAKDYGMSAIAFNQLLAKYKIQHRVGNFWVINEPYSKMGYAKTETRLLADGLVITQTKWTQKGRMFLYNILKKFSCFPVCEREEPMTALF